jgi:hypothetical protein
MEKNMSQAERTLELAIILTVKAMILNGKSTEEIRSFIEEQKRLWI